MYLPQLHPKIQFTFNQLIEVFGEVEALATMRLLVEDLLNVEWIRLKMGFVSLGEKDEDVLDAAIKRVINGEPPQYVTGKAWFYGREFMVDKRVLIPRRETEELVEWVLKKMGERVWKGLDIGTGSGCIPITIAKEHPQAQLYAIDISSDALEVARSNADFLNVEIDFEEMDILTAREDAFSELDFIVSNPPYVPEKELRDMEVRVRDHEPSMALFVPNDDPLRFYKAIADIAPHWLKPDGVLFFEIHEDYGQETVEMLRVAGFSDIELKNDMQGKARMVKAEP